MPERPKAPRVLIVAASKHGSTLEIAHAIAAALREAGAEPTVHEANSHLPQSDGFDAAIIGSAVYMGHWMGEARDTARGLAPALAGKPVWIFSSGPIGDPPVPDPASIDVSEQLELLGAREHRVFRGSLDSSRLGLAERLTVKLVRAHDGDYRNWDEIRAWAKEIANSLQTPA